MTRPRTHNRTSPTSTAPSALARTLYRQLVRRLRRLEPSITYRELAAAVRVHYRSRRFHVALGELAHACRARGLPCLPALVWRADARRPATGYYVLAHPRARSERARLAAWEREHARVVRDARRFPPSLEGLS